MNTQKLKPSDLRIGNFITNKYIDSENVYKVKAIKRNQINTDHGKKFIRTVVGIPLTEEWLLKFGFSRSDKGSASAQFNLGINPVTNDNMIQLIWLKNLMTTGYSLDGFPFYTNGHFKINYVHQLQNLYYALTGEELEIKI